VTAKSGHNAVGFRKLQKSSFSRVVDIGLRIQSRPFEERHCGKTFAIYSVLTKTSRSSAKADRELIWKME
jgi:hypothetical protein